MIGDEIPTGALALAAVGAVIGAVLGYLAKGFDIAAPFAIIGATAAGLIGQRLDRAARS
ncbi:hypothetical protein [Methylocystis parvus]|uniref:hypothetical protein n=1 Tax=Methylocystis parvus TaxID=134 RepID=UPI00031D53AE|nr:hypothetical protein [Methylocystis parvus]WBK00119.1 hypothetical protein MMG94_19465 [Methylocystis parvus OBBP]